MEFDYSKTYYKVMNDREIHHDMQYHDGLNKDTIPFNPYGTCEPGGLYFTDIENIFNFIEDNSMYVREIHIPTDALVYRDPDMNKWKADKIILGKRYDLNIDTIEYLVEQGADIHTNGNYPLQIASANGHLEVVKYLVKHGADIHTDDDLALRWASANGHLEVVKYLVKHGADMHADNDLALKWASEYGHLDVVKYLNSLS